MTSPVLPPPSRSQFSNLTPALTSAITPNPGKEPPPATPRLAPAAAAHTAALLPRHQLGPPQGTAGEEADGLMDYGERMLGVLSGCWPCLHLGRWPNPLAHLPFSRSRCTLLRATLTFHFFPSSIYLATPSFRDNSILFLFLTPLSHLQAKATRVRLEALGPKTGEAEGAISEITASRRLDFVSHERNVNRDRCVYAFSFADEDDASDFADKVRNRKSVATRAVPSFSPAPKPNPPAISTPPQTYSKEPLPQRSSVASAIPRSSSNDTIEAEPKAKKKGSKKEKSEGGGGFFGMKSKKEKKTGKIDKAMISAPTEFKHVSHVGYNPKTGFSAENIPLEWKAIFQKAGITEVLKCF
ncbi:hypothetical protein HDU96_006783 [Phlyctochytrium bullatum]|nr:hypothetical protein HDU96_006783 [Phlyctochytrium bullatum]